MMKQGWSFLLSFWYGNEQILNRDILTCRVWICTYKRVPIIYVPRTMSIDNCRLLYCSLRVYYFSHTWSIWTLQYTFGSVGWLSTAWITSKTHDFGRLCLLTRISNLDDCRTSTVGLISTAKYGFRIYSSSLKDDNTIYAIFNKSDITDYLVHVHLKWPIYRYLKNRI